MVLKEALKHSGLLSRTNDRTTRAYLTVGSTMRIMFRLVFSVIRLQFHFMNVKHLSIHGARLIHHMAGPLLLIRFLCMLLQQHLLSSVYTFLLLLYLEASLFCPTAQLSSVASRAVPLRVDTVFTMSYR